MKANVILSAIIFICHVTVLQADDDVRVRDFYVNQAKKHLGSGRPIPDVLREFPGLDGAEFGHWGNYDESRNREEQWAHIDLGGLVCAVTGHFGAVTTKAVTVQLGTKGSLSTLFDPDRLSFTDAWKGGSVKFQEYRFGVQGAVIHKLFHAHWEKAFVGGKAQDGGIGFVQLAHVYLQVFVY